MPEEVEVFVHVVKAAHIRLAELTDHPPHFSDSWWVGDFITMWHQIFVFIVDIYSVSSSDLTLKSGVLLAANWAAEPQQLTPGPLQCNVMVM